MRDITASGSFTALAEAIRLNGVAKAQRDYGSPTSFARSDPGLEDLPIPESATVIAAH
jgi:hypothetical protein